MIELMTPDEIAAEYMERGWQADVATWESVASATPANEALVNKLVK